MSWRKRKCVWQVSRAGAHNLQGPFPTFDPPLKKGDPYAKKTN